MANTSTNRTSPADYKVMTSDLRGVLSVGRCLSTSLKISSGCTYFYAGTSVKVTVPERGATGTMLNRLELKNPDIIWDQDIPVFSNVNKKCVLVLWQPISSFTKAVMRGCPQTVHFKNAEMNEILAHSSAMGLGMTSTGNTVSKVTVFDKNGKMHVFQGQRELVEADIFYISKGSTNTAYVEQPKPKAVDTADFASFSSILPYALSIDFNNEISAVSGQPLAMLGLGNSCKAVCFKQHVDLDKIDGHSFLGSERNGINKIYFNSNTIEEVLSTASKSGLGFKMASDGKMIKKSRLSCYCSDGTVVFNDVSSDEVPLAEELDVASTYVWKDEESSPAEIQLPSGGLSQLYAAKLLGASTCKAVVQEGTTLSRPQSLYQLPALKTLMLRTCPEKALAQFEKLDNGTGTFTPLSEIQFTDSTVSDILALGIADLGIGLHYDILEQCYKTDYAEVYCIDGVITVNGSSAQS